MENKSIIEWLQEQYHLRGESLPSGVFQQAKEMHKQEIMNAFEKAYRSGYRDNGDSGIDYYAETFVSKGVREDALQFLATQAQELNLGYEVELPQQEISDEEIWEASINYDNGATYETPIVHFQQGAFWYREQLKSKNND